MLQYRNTPSCKDGLSPAQKLFGHPIQDTLPAQHCLFAPEWQKSTQEAEQQATETMKDAKISYDAHSHPLPDIHVGSSVTLQNQETKLWDIYGTVVTIGQHRRYHIKTKAGQILVRNGHFLRHRIPASLQSCILACSPTNTPSSQAASPLPPRQPPRRHDTLSDPASHLQDLLKITAGHDMSALVTTPTAPMLGGSVGTWTRSLTR